MPNSQFILKTPDGVNIFAQQWLPSGDIRASINLIHGLGEHSGRYAHVASALNQAGFAVSAFDLRGHGKSDGSRGHIPSYDTAARDILQFLQDTSNRLPNLPQFLYGHSLGGALVLYTSLFHTPSIKGTIATSPGLNPGKVPPVKLFAARLLSRLSPSFAMNNGLDVSNLSHDPAVIEAYQTDPLVHPLISARLGYEFITNGQKILSFTGQFPVPLLLLQGAKDHLVDPGTNRKFVQNLTGDITYKEFEEGYHELHNEPWKEIVFSTFIDWINSKLQ